jgi:UDP-N-acetylmuramoyl-L-alanyl-D-glutamate--2,6-diaminopimelate ligase
VRGESARNAGWRYHAGMEALVAPGVRELFVSVGVTGTNGKTTTATMIEAILAAAGERTARVTTLGTWVLGERIAEEATVESFRAMIDRAAALGVTTLVLESSSLSLSQGFAHAWPADLAVFTNLSRDHLDYHATFEHYLASKAQLFVTLRPGGAAVLNAADPASGLLASLAPAGVRRFGFAARPPVAWPEVPLTLAASHLEVSRAGTRVTLAPSPLASALGGSLSLRVLGAVNAENALAAAVAAHARGVAPAAVTSALAAFPGVPGRFERVASAPLVVVDYAHTPDALLHTLSLGRALAGPSGRLFAVFGCGGDRDAGKRAEMGRVAGRAADLTLVTTDNPRTEDPELIAVSIVAGLEAVGARHEYVPDRVEAIARAVGTAGDEDVVVIAGKGHEAEQVLADRVVPFDDATVAREAWEARGRIRRKASLA